MLISRLFLDRTDWKKTQNLSDWIADVLTLAKELSSQGVNLVIIGPPPHFNFEDISLCKSYKWKKSSCDIARDSIYTQIQEIYTEIKQKTKNTKNIYTFNQFNILCPQTHKQCSAFYNGVPIFKDSDHLNPLGSAILANPFIKFLDKQALI